PVNRRPVLVSWRFSPRPPGTSPLRRPDNVGMTWRQLSATATAVVLAAALAGCGDGDGAPTGDPRVTTPTSTAAPTSEGPTSAPPTPGARLREFEIVEGQASPPLDRVAVAHGETVRIVVTSDQPDEIHLHGYDRSAQVGPGEEG